MKVLIFLMLICSVLTGIKTNIGWFSIYGGAFAAPISRMMAGTYHYYELPIWLLLLVSPALVISLLFFRKKDNFKTRLFCFPLLYIIAFTLQSIFAFILLIPFIIVWIIALIKQLNNNHLVVKHL